MKKILGVLLSIVLVFAMVACGAKTEGKKENEQEKPKDAKVILAEATEKMQAIESMDISTVTNMGMTTNGETVDMQMEMGVQVQEQGKESMKMAMPMVMKMPSQGLTMEINMYYVDGYCYMDMLGSKLKSPMNLTDIMESMKDGTAATDISTEGMKELKMEEKENAIVITFVGDTEKMLDYSKSLMASMQSMNGLENADITLDEIKGTITLHKDGNIKEQVVDMKMTMTMEGEAIATTVNTTTTYNSIGEDVVVELPDFSEYQEASFTE